MSEPPNVLTLNAPADDAPVPAAPARPSRSRRRYPIAAVGTLAVLAAAPFFLEAFWLRMGLFVCASAVAALGLSLLLGHGGQLSLGHSFFVAVGAYGYTFLASDTQSVGTSDQVGLGLPPVLALVLAVLLAGLAGLLFSPIAGRLRGIYLGIASLGLVFAGLHLLSNMRFSEALTGGHNGRDVPAFSIAGFTFDQVPGEAPRYAFGVLLGREELLWYLAVTVTALAYAYYRNLVRGRPGRALRAVRDRELMAGIMGVPVGRYKAYVFVVSSMYAGLGGVLLALAFNRIVPSTFDVSFAVALLAMVVIGGLGSATGAVVGAAFVVCLPRLLDHYADLLPWIASSSSTDAAGGIDPAVAANFAYGAAVIALLIAQPGGVAAAGNRLLHRIRRVIPAVRTR